MPRVEPGPDATVSQSPSTAESSFGKQAKLFALIVNYDSGGFAERCSASLAREWERAGRPAQNLVRVVVDNASPIDQSAHLAVLREQGCLVIESDENLGYAAGMNLAYAQTEGSPEDVVAILNPDLVFLPGSLERVLQTITEDETIGACDALACMDPAGVFHMPSNPLPTLVDATFVNVAHRFGWVGRWYARKRLNVALPWWQKAVVHEARMLSGANVFLRRAVVEELGRVMDPRYPLYFEDTDLFRELSKRGYRLVHDSRARVLHHWSRSAGAGARFEGEPARRYAISHRLYYEKFYGKFGARYAAWIQKQGIRWAGKGPAPMHSEIVDLGQGPEAPTLEWEGERDYLIEIGVTPNWLIACGILGHGSSWTCPDEAWEWLFGGGYYLRAVDRNTRELLGAWRRIKTTPDRAEAVTFEEIDRYWTAEGCRRLAWDPLAAASGTTPEGPNA